MAVNHLLQALMAVRIRILGDAWFFLALMPFDLRNILTCVHQNKNQPKNINIFFDSTIIILVMLNLWVYLDLFINLFCLIYLRS